MTVFKSFLKILKKKSVGVLIYIIVFLIITLVNINSSDQNMNKAIGNKVNSKTRISVQNDFSENPTYSGLEKYLDDTFKTVKVKNDRKTITESLLNGYVHYVLRIDGKGNMSYYTYNDTGEAVMINQKIREYMKINNILKEFGIAKPVDKTKEILAENVGISYVGHDSNAEKLMRDSMSSYYKPLAFILMAILMIGIYIGQSRFGESEIVQRINISATSPAKVNLRVFLGAIAFMLIIWLIFTVLSAYSFGVKNVLFVGFGRKFLLASALYMLPAGGIAFLMAVISKSEAMNSVLTNIISIGFAFISGVFVPLNLLPGFVQKIALISPMYWYGKVCDLISADTFTIETSALFFGVQIFMMCIFVTAAILLLRNRSTKKLA